MTPTDDDRKGPRRATDQQPSIMKILGLILACITLGSLIFTAGVNWAGVDQLKKDQPEYVRKDVLDQQMKRMDDKMNEMLRQIEEMRGELRDARRKP